MKKINVVMFVSHYCGLAALKELVQGDISYFINVVGVVTDDPGKNFCSPQKRVWRYPYSEQEKMMVHDFAIAHNIPVYRERIKTDEFYALFENKWKPDLCIMAIFGQLVSPRLFNYPRLGFYNMHPTFDDIWPAFGGCDPMEQLIAVKKPHYVFAMHHVEETFDSGKLVAYSDKIFMPHEPHPVELFKLACDPLRSLLRKELPKLLV